MLRETWQRHLREVYVAEEGEKSWSIDVGCVFKDLLGLCAKVLLRTVSATYLTHCWVFKCLLPHLFPGRGFTWETRVRSPGGLCKWARDWSHCSCLLFRWSCLSLAISQER